MAGPRRWIKLNYQILDDPEWGMLLDSDWRKRMEEIIKNPLNWHFDPLFWRVAWVAIRIKRTREVFARDEHKCRQCGAEKNLTIDHIVPLAKGGTNELNNLQILCRSCNSKKGAR